MQEHYDARDSKISKNSMRCVVDLTISKNIMI